MQRQNITFTSGGLSCAGWFYPAQTWLPLPLW